MTELESLTTAADVALNVALVVLAATVTLGGTVATFVLALERVTMDPPGGAAAFRVTVPTEVDDAATGLGLNVRALGAVGAVTVMEVLCVPLNVPEILNVAL